MKNGALACALLATAFSASAFAEPRSFEFGWMDFGSCNRIKYYKDSLGIPWPTNESAGQRLIGYVKADIPNSGELISKVQKCVGVGVAAAGLGAMLTGPQGAWPVFSSAFNACISVEGAAISASALQVTVESRCNW